MTLEEQLNVIFVKASYIDIEDTSRDFRTGYLVCKRESCRKTVDSDDAFCRHCGTAKPATRLHFNENHRFRMKAGNHGACYPEMAFGATWQQAIEAFVARILRETS